MRDINIHTGILGNVKGSYLNTRRENESIYLLPVGLISFLECVFCRQCLVVMQMVNLFFFFFFLNHFWFYLSMISDQVFYPYLEQTFWIFIYSIQKYHIIKIIARKYHIFKKLINIQILATWVVYNRFELYVSIYKIFA